MLLCTKLHGQTYEFPRPPHLDGRGEWDGDVWIQL